MTLLGPNVSCIPRSQSCQNCFVCQQSFSEDFETHVTQNPRHLSRVKSDNLYLEIDKEFDSANFLKKRRGVDKNKFKVPVFARNDSDRGDLSLEHPDDPAFEKVMVSVGRRGKRMEERNMAEHVFSLSVHVRNELQQVKQQVRVLKAELKKR